MPKIMTWNCLGFDAGGPKDQALQAYMQANGIDYAFLQEGNPSRGDAVSEAGGLSNSITFNANQSETLLRVVRAFTGPRASVFSLNANGGVGNKYYNIVTRPGAAPPPEPLELDYAQDDDVKNWVVEPASVPFPITDKGNIVLAWDGNRFVDQGSQAVQSALSTYIRQPITTRLNLIGHRRPKKTIIGGIEIIFWHAPLGAVDYDHLGFGAPPPRLDAGG